MVKAHTIGSGWKGQSLRHSNARRFGKAGGTYLSKDEVWKIIAGDANIGYQDLPEGTYTLKEINLQKTNVPELSYFQKIDDGDNYEFKQIEILKQKYSELPPIIVDKQGQKYKIIDGYHRSFTAKLLGKSKIKAYIHYSKSKSIKELKN